MLLIFAGCVGARLVEPRPAPLEASPPAQHDARPAPTAPTAAQAAVVQPIDAAGLARLLENDSRAPLVVNFWATWCGPCVRELPVLATVAAESTAARFVLVSVDIQTDRRLILPLLDRAGLALPTMHLDVPDASATLARLVPGWSDSIPLTLVLDPGGAPRARFVGAVDPEALRAALAD